MGEKEINQFLTHLAVDQHVAASTQNQALCAIIFLYKKVLKKDIDELEFTWAKKPKRLPIVFTRKEVKSILAQLSGDKWIMANLLYGSGLRLMECLRLRVKDVDFEYNQIIVRSGKGQKDRTTILPTSLIPELKKQIERVKRLHEQDIKNGYKVLYGEKAIGKLVRSAGGRCNRDKQVWQIAYREAINLGLEDRIVEK